MKFHSNEKSHLHTVSITPNMLQCASQIMCAIIPPMTKETTMQNLYRSCYELDQRCLEEYALSEEILMEHAALGMANFIRSRFPKGSSLLIVAGKGNNGADGLALARLLVDYCDVRFYLPFDTATHMAKLQLKRAFRVNAQRTSEIVPSDIIVDALFGAGLDRELDEATTHIICRLNDLEGYKIACDVPTGLDIHGNPHPVAFHAHTTITMGGLKEGLYNDNAKDIVGDIICINLGLPQHLYEEKSDTKLLEPSDLILPSRKKQLTHKGSFGHLALYCGVKEGAAILAGLTALRFGSGLVTLIGDPQTPLPYSLMHDTHLPANTTAIALGMGYGTDVYGIEHLVDLATPIILDADILHHDIIEKFIDNDTREVILTPHPKEFISLYNLSMANNITMEELLLDKLHYAKEFAKAYPHITLILKGANTIIAQNNSLYINPYGTSILSKGGSGDILSGLCGALLAQGYPALDAAIQASLALTMAARNYQGASYSLLPTDLIEEIAKLEKNCSLI